MRPSTLIATFLILLAGSFTASGQQEPSRESSASQKNDTAIQKIKCPAKSGLACAVVSIQVIPDNLGGGTQVGARLLYASKNPEIVGKTSHLQESAEVINVDEYEGKALIIEYERIIDHPGSGIPDIFLEGVNILAVVG